MSIDDAISKVSPTFGLPIAGRGPGALIKKMTAKLIWPFLRHQVDVNNVLLAELRDLQARQEALQAIVDQQLSTNGHTTVSIRQLGDQIDFVEDGLHNVENALHILEGQYTAVVLQRESHLADVQTHLTLRTQQLENQIDLGHRQLLARFYDGFGALQRDTAELTRQFALLEEKSAALSREITEQFGSLAGQFESLTESDRATMSGLLARMAEVDYFLREVKRSFPAPVPPEQLASLPSGFDALSSAFAEIFRGSFAEIKERLAVYLPDLKSVAHLGPVLDVGCGRGELLELLAEAEIEAYGVELNQEIVDAAVDRGLDARLDDALHHLRSLPEKSLGAVTAIHVVEHLDVDTLIEFTDLCLRALRPGGLIIFETPNPDNVKVGANYFWMDPTHLHPLPSAFLRFVVSMRGFDDAEIVPFKRTSPFGSTLRLDEASEQLSERLANELFGPEDYAVIARRAD